MASLMQAAQVGHLGDSRLRFVFGDTVLSFSLASDATYEDVARSLGAFKSVLWQSSPIDVTPGSRDGDSICRSDFAKRTIAIRRLFRRCRKIGYHQPNADQRR